MRDGTTPRLSRRARVEVRDRLGLVADQAPAEVGHGCRAGRDEPAVGEDGSCDPAGVGRAGGQPPRQALVRRADVGRAQRSSRHHRAGVAVRAADRGRSSRRLRPGRPARRAGHVHPPRARRERLDHAPPVRRAQPGGVRSGAGDGGSAASRRPGRRRTPCSGSTTSASAPTSCRPATSTSGGSPLAPPIRSC